MNTTLRNLTLSAAALAALTVTAPKASADDHARRPEAPRQEFREGGNTGRGHVVVAPARPFVRYGYGYGYRTPFRVFSGFRFYSALPGPGYVYIPNYGSVLPPFFGAVWVPGHDDIGGAWIEGFWQ